MSKNNCTYVSKPEKHTFIVYHCLSYQHAQGLDTGSFGSTKVESRGICVVHKIFEKINKFPESTKDIVGFHFYDEVTAFVEVGNELIKMKSSPFNVSEGYYPEAEVFTLAQVKKINQKIATEMIKHRLSFAFVPKGGTKLVPCKYLRRRKGFIIAKRVNTENYRLNPM